MRRARVLTKRVRLSGVLVAMVLVAGCAAIPPVQINSFDRDFRQRITSDPKLGPILVSVSESIQVAVFIRTIVVLNKAILTLEPRERDEILLRIGTSLLVACEPLYQERRQCQAHLMDEQGNLRMVIQGPDVTTVARGIGLSSFGEDTATASAG